VINFNRREIVTLQVMLENRLATFPAKADDILFTLNSIASRTNIATRLDCQPDIGDALPARNGYNSFRASAQPDPLRTTHLIASPFCTSP
jgi:hypothetical protein